MDYIILLLVAACVLILLIVHQDIVQFGKGYNNPIIPIPKTATPMIRTTLPTPCISLKPPLCSLIRLVTLD